MDIKCTISSGPHKFQGNLFDDGWQCKYQILCPSLVVTQPAFICLKLTIEILEQDVKYVQS